MGNERQRELYSTGQRHGRGWRQELLDGLGRRRYTRSDYLLRKKDLVKRVGYAALVMDLDGTLIGRDERVSPRVTETVQRIAGRLHLTIASGRESADVLRFADELGMTAPQVSDNGALLLEAATGRPLHSSPLGQRRAQEIVARLGRLGTAFIATHPGGTETSVAGAAGRALTRVSALDLEEDDADEMVSSFDDTGDLHVVKVSLPYNGLWAVDFTKAGVNKASAVGHLARLLEISPGQMIAVGDSYNDVPMLQACGLRVAMADAPEELKAIAHYVAPFRR